LVDQPHAALAVQGRRIEVVEVADHAKTSDDLALDMMEMLTGFCARLYARQGAHNQALRAFTAAKRNR
jgi:putative resolvase